ncbi:MAG: hypothetical protein J7516_09940, partial [Shinella sp.]|nr:hypothetical protein [Shinella sp.]
AQSRHPRQQQWRPAAEARRHKADGVICGHIHHAVITEIDGIRYINSGDWVESCTAIAEHHDGEMELITWQTLTAVPEPVSIASRSLGVVATAGAEAA